MSDTLETDELILRAEFGPTGWEWRQHSRRLERERDESHKIAERAIDDLAWFHETNAQRLRSELNKLKEDAK